RFPPPAAFGFAPCRLTTVPFETLRLATPGCAPRRLGERRGETRGPAALARSLPPAEALRLGEPRLRPLGARRLHRRRASLQRRRALAHRQPEFLPQAPRREVQPFERRRVN